MSPFNTVSNTTSSHAMSKVIYCDDLISHIFIHMIDKKSCLSILLVCKRFNDLYRLRVPCQLKTYVSHYCDRIESLQWIISLGAPVKNLCRYVAAGGDHLSILQWLRSQDPPCPWNKGKCRRGAKYEHHIKTVTWIDNLR